MNDGITKEMTIKCVKCNEPIDKYLIDLELAQLNEEGYIIVGPCCGTFQFDVEDKVYTLDGIDFTIPVDMVEVITTIQNNLKNNSKP